MGNLIVGLIVIAVIALAVASVVRDRKRGGCPGCSGDCHCEGCGDAGSKPTANH